ncbi:MAG: hypothetical protein ABI824_12595 [Acidobacteriota bacterium]
MWDPIGLQNDPDAQDEYDGYIGRVYELLVGKLPQSELAAYLYWAAHDHMGLSATRLADMMSTVETLSNIRLD